MRKNETCSYELRGKKSVAKSNQQGLDHAQQSLTHLIQSAAKVHIDMQIRVHIFARVSHISNLVMTTSTTDTSHRSRVEVGVQDLLHVQVR